MLLLFFFIHQRVSLAALFFLHVQRSWFYAISRRHLNNFLHIHCTGEHGKKTWIFHFGEREFNNVERETSRSSQESEKSFFFILGNCTKVVASLTLPPFLQFPYASGYKKNSRLLFIFLRFLFLLFLLSSLHMSLDCSASHNNNNNNLLHHSSRYWCIVSNTHTHKFFDVFGSVGNEVLHNLYCHIKDSRRVMQLMRHA